MNFGLFVSSRVESLVSITYLLLFSILFDMGASQSTSGLDTCLRAVPSLQFASQSTNPLYKLTNLHPYNLDVAVSTIAVTYPSTQAHVQGIVKCAAANKVNVQAKGGGHSYANYAWGGGYPNTLQIDLKNFQQVTVDATTGIANIGAGGLLGDITTKLINQGNRAFAHGVCPQVGIGGHATMGGLGPASRMWGSALDHVAAANVVIANGSLVRVSPTQNSDLFWAVKGAGGSFGVVTDFDIITHPAPTTAISYSYTFSGRPFTKYGQRFKDWMHMISDPALSRQLASEVVFTPVGLVISGMFYGTEDEFKKLNLSSVFPDATNTQTLVFNSWAGSMGHWFEDLALQVGGGLPSNFYAKSLVFTPKDVIPDAGIDAMLSFLDSADAGSLLWFGIFDLSGGAVMDTAPDATAFSHRDALFYFQPYIVTIGKVPDKSKKFLSDWNELLSQYSPGTRNNGAYAGYVDPTLGQQGQLEYWNTNYARLQQLKQQYDSTDMFRNPQSVRLPGQ